MTTTVQDLAAELGVRYAVAYRYAIDAGAPTVGSGRRLELDDQQADAVRVLAARRHVHHALNLLAEQALAGALEDRPGAYITARVGPVVVTFSRPPGARLITEAEIRAAAEPSPAP